MRKVLTGIAAVAATIFAVSCQKAATQEVEALSASFEVSSNPCYVGDEIHFKSTTTGGVQPYEFNWDIDGVQKTGEDVKYTFTEAGTKNIVLTVKDNRGKEATKKKLVIVNPAKVSDEGTIEAKWVGKTEGYNKISSAAIANDGSVYCTTCKGKLYKFSSTGAAVWSKSIYSGTGDVYGTPSIDEDGTIFIGGGTDSNNNQGTFKAYNPDGSVKWTYSDWFASSGEPHPAFQGCIGGISGNYVYFGSVGTNGTLQAVNKSTGARVGFVMPTGGVRTGVVITADGFVCTGSGSYGIAGTSKAKLDDAATAAEGTTWKLWNNREDPTGSQGKNMMGGLAAVKIAGVDCLAGICTDGVGTKVFAVKASDGTPVCVHYIENGEYQDQGGVVITPEGYIVASLNYTAGKENGGIIVVDPSTADGKKVWSYNVQEKVSGSCAVDNNGNIHFGSESGHYYVIDKNGKLVVKQDLAKIVTDKDAASFEGLAVAKVWSSVVIGDDGTCYLCFTENENRYFGGVAALVIKDGNGKVVCNGPAASGWPMIGQNRRHTCVQK